MDQYQNVIAHKRKQIDRIQQEIRDIEYAWICACHPLRIGDRVTVEDGREIEIFARGIDGENWTADGRVIRRDGKPGRGFITWKRRMDN